MEATTTVSHSLVKALRSVSAFSELDDAALLAIAGASSNLHWRAGSAVFEQGAPGDGLYIVLSGSVRIFDESDPDTEVERIEAGNYFGELSLLLDITRRKCAAAAEDSELLVLPKQSFDDLLASNQELAARIRERLDERVAAGHAGTQAGD
ncbi:MAG: cyclic nucleotide-binding domain-containing protein [Gaiellaceae bacterium]